MSTDQATAGADVDDVEDAARDLGEAIAALPEYEAFEDAKATVESSPELQDRISEFERLREEFAVARQTGEATQEDVTELKRAQRELHSQPEMAAYLEAREDLRDRLETLNRAISDPLAVDFGGEAGGCCQDE